MSPDARIEWKGKSEELKEISNELFIIFIASLSNGLFSHGGQL